MNLRTYVFEIRYYAQLPETVRIEAVTEESAWDALDELYPDHESAELIDVRDGR